MAPAGSIMTSLVAMSLWLSPAAAAGASSAAAAVLDASSSSSSARRGRGGFLRKAKFGREQNHIMQRLHPFYHTTDGIRDELRRLSGRCPGMTLETRAAGGGDHGAAGTRSIDVVTVKAPGTQPVNKNFILFGEHSRELISPESGLHLVKTLCGETDLSEQAKQILVNSEFQIIVNANPESRKKVEQGDFCLRVNPDGVDLNRNWDEKWDANAVLDPGDTNPGPAPFSEPETQLFRDLVTAYRPTNFLTVHSGTRGMYMPWAYDMDHLATRNQPEMMKILRDLDKHHCECPFGAAGKEVGYSCPGTCLDWVYEKLDTPFAFAFEIYAGPQFDDFLKERWQEKMEAGGAFLQDHSHLGHPHFRDFFDAHPSSFVQLNSKSGHTGTRSEMSPGECFGNFNPDTKELFDTTVENWSGAYLDMAAMVATNLLGARGGGSGGNATAIGAIV